MSDSRKEGSRGSSISNEEGGADSLINRSPRVFVIVDRNSVEEQETRAHRGMGNRQGTLATRRAWRKSPTLSCEPKVSPIVISNEYDGAKYCTVDGPLVVQTIVRGEWHA